MKTQSVEGPAAFVALFERKRIEAIFGYQRSWIVPLSTALTIVLVMSASCERPTPPRPADCTSNTGCSHDSGRETAVAPARTAECESNTAVQVHPGDNLVRLISDKLPHTIFCIHDGTYRISKPIEPKSHDAFEGIYPDNSRPHIKAVKGAIYVFDASGTHNVRIEGLAISGAGYLPAYSPVCPEGHPCGGGGVHGGKNLTLYNDRVYNNADVGVGGAGAGLLINRSILDHNGSAPFVRKGVWVDSAGVKSVNPFTVKNSSIHDNYWDGVWCDIECGKFKVVNNYIYRNGNSGVHYEISRGPALISSNIIKDNKRGGIFIQSAQNVSVQGNAFEGNDGVAVGIGEDSRMTLKGVRVGNNSFNGERLSGCDLGGVFCPRNRQTIAPAVGISILEALSSRRIYLSGHNAMWMSLKSHRGNS